MCQTLASNVGAAFGAVVVVFKKVGQPVACYVVEFQKSASGGSRPAS